MSKIASIESDTHPCNYLHHLSVLDNKLRYYWIIFEIRLNHRFDDSHRTLDFSFKLLVNQFTVFKILGNQRFANTRYWSHTVQIFRQTNFVLNILKRLFGKPKINNEVSILSQSYTIYIIWLWVQLPCCNITPRYDGSKQMVIANLCFVY